MDTGGSILYVYRHRPIAKFIYWLSYAIVPVGAGIYLREIPEFAIVCFLIGVIPVVCALFLRTRVLIVTAGGLLVIQRPVVRVLGSYDFFPGDSIRHLRYWSEIHEPKDRYATRETWYYLDMLTMDGRLVRLLDDRISQIDPKVGRAVATNLGVAYEEYLADQ